MAHIFTFKSQQFQPADERPNPINPIGGEGLLIWLTTQLKARGYEYDVPDAEDWGWYTSVTNSERIYLLGASGDFAPPGESTEWTVQLELNRSVWDKLSGAKRMLSDDDVSAAIERVLHGNPQIVDLEIERGG